jgi:dipeptidyl aminopeptidase/acylaminoacyl peptidase
LPEITFQIDTGVYRELLCEKREIIEIMEKIKNFSGNVVTLTLLLIFGVWVFLFLSSRLQKNELATQATNVKPTSAPMAENPTPTSTFEPEEYRPEPTWTPAIILPEGTPLPLPSPPPAPTATPVNPDESEFISFDVPASLGAISPDGNTLAFNRWQVETKGNPYNQVWLLDLASKQTTKLVEVGTVSTDQTWSSDGKKLAYQGFSSNGLEEVSIVGIDGKDAHSLLKNEDLLGYYWIDPQQIGLIRTNSIERVDLTGRAIEKQMVKLPTGHPGPTNYIPKPKAAGSAQGTVVVTEEGTLRIISSNGQEITIQPESNEQIYEFSLSPNGKQVAYMVSQGVGTSLWISDLDGNNQQKLFERVEENRGNIHHIAWSPNNQTIVVSWSEFGTSQDTFLVWIDIKSEQVIPLGVHGVIDNVIFSPNGQSLFYSRTSFPDDSLWGKTTFYQLKVK